MSSLDNAFIKVYGKGRSPRAAQASIRPSSELQAEARSGEASGTQHVSKSGSETTVRVEAAQPKIRPPHAHFPAAAPQKQAGAHAPGPNETPEVALPVMADTASAPLPLDSWKLEPLIIMPAVYDASLATVTPQVPDIIEHAAIADLSRIPAALPSVSQRPLEMIPSVLPPTTPRSDEPGAGLTAVWEVDAFCWPEICDRLEAAPDECLQDAGRQLLTASQQGLKLLAVTSCRRGEGRTTLALSLARAAAAYGARVAVFDGDCRNPQLATRLGVDATGGWQDALHGHLSLADIAITSLEDNVTLLPLTSMHGAHDLPLNDPQVARLLATATRHFDLIIVDMEPMDLFPPPLMPQRPLAIDAAIVVQDVRLGAESDVNRCVDYLREAGIQSVGIAENFAPRA